jgi:hypothetical protein
MAIVAEGARCQPWYWPLLKTKTAQLPNLEHGACSDFTHVTAR